MGKVCSKNDFKSEEEFGDSGTPNNKLPRISI